MSLLPKEHGAYGQLAFPPVTALAAAGLSGAGLLIAAATVAGFLAHEPVMVLIGSRGPRAARELSRRAWRWLSACTLLAGVAGVGVWVLLPAAARWSLLVPLVPAAGLAAAMARGREKSWAGEICAAIAFSAVAMPIALAAGAPIAAALAVAVPFALLFTATTLAVRVVVLRVRGGGDPAATAATRRAVYVVTWGAAGLLAALTITRTLPVAVLAAAAPGLITAALVAYRPPAPVRLRSLGWTLVAVTTITAAIIVVTA